MFSVEYANHTTAFGEISVNFMCVIMSLQWEFKIFGPLGVQDIFYTCYAFIFTNEPAH